MRKLASRLHSDNTGQCAARSKARDIKVHDPTGMHLSPGKRRGQVAVIIVGKGLGSKKVGPAVLRMLTHELNATARVNPCNTGILLVSL